MIQRHQRLHIEAFPLLSFLAAVGEAFCGFFANSLELFTRRTGTFGVRYLNSLGLLTTFCLAGFTKGTLELIVAVRGEVGGLLHALPGLAGNAFPPLRLQAYLFNLYSYAVLAMGAAHLAAQWRTNRGGLRYHTYFSGIPWAMPLYERLPWGDLITAKTYYEPAACFLASYLVCLLDSVLGTWIWFASICMFIRAKLHYSRARAADLDAHDALMESGDIFASIRLAANRSPRPRPSVAAGGASAQPQASPADAGAILDEFASALAPQAAAPRPQGRGASLLNRPTSPPGTNPAENQA